MKRRIDMVIPFVDNTDVEWRRIYVEYCERTGLTPQLIEINTERYQDNLKLINYQLNLINKHMPFINKIYLLLMTRNQAPKDLPSNVICVYHGAFIPQKFLPTFNSTTIEMFLWRIKDLSEYFIYANDDMLPFRDLKEEDFFTKDGKIKIEWWNEDIRKCDTLFRQQCYNSYIGIAYRTHTRVEKYLYQRPAHSFTPMIKSHCEMAYNLLKDVIEKHIRAFRTVYQYNQYIYPIFEKFVYGTCDSTIDFLYTQLQEDIDLDHDIVCLNVVPKNKEQDLKNELEKLI